jgi:hypothetical protein
MAEQEMDAAIGKARREYREAKKEMDALQSKAGRVGQFAIKLQNALGDPSSIRFLRALQCSQHRAFEPGSLSYSQRQSSPK